jgi:O-antigen ligase
LKATPAPEIGLLLAGGACLLPFLLPYHQQPVLSFYPEWLAVALGTAAAAAAFISRGFRADAALPAPALWLAAFALFLALRAALGSQAYPQADLLAALYVLFAVVMVQLGTQLVATLGIGRVAVVLAAFVLAGALANAVAGVIQFYGRPDLFEDVIAELRGGRAYGNIAQANLYTNYLALGQVALLFLWLRARLRTGYAITGLVLLVVASALAGARGALLYAIWFAVLGALAPWVLDRSVATRLKWGAYCVAGAVVAAQIVVPWVNSALQLGLAGEGALDRLLISQEQGYEPRLPVFLLAARIFAAAPLFGVGMGEFSGAAFALGLHPSLTAIGEVWTSPHNLPLHLLAEVGAVGAILALGGLCIWVIALLRRVRTVASPALWWIVAAVGVELIHSLIEYPLWSANFFGLTALLIGASTVPTPCRPAIARAARRAGIGVCALLAAMLALMLRDYVRLDIARAAGTRVTLAPAAQGKRDAETMQDLRHGLLAPVAELWIFSGAPLDRRDVASKLAMGERVARHWPANAIIVRRAIFLAFDGRAGEAHAQLAAALHAFPQKHMATVMLLKQALGADPVTIAPLIALAERMSTGARDRPQCAAAGNHVHDACRRGNVVIRRAHR